MKIEIPAVEGFFTVEEEAHLIGGRFKKSGSYCFPKDLGGSDPNFPEDEVEEVLLSRFGKIWSYTNSVYPPPPPFIAADPYEPIVIAAVELEEEKIVIIGQVVNGYRVEDLSIGMSVEVKVGTLYEDSENRYLTWMWKPLLEEQKQDKS
ncbi:MAG: Zn-ribbon domain-containing OB-fold protein [Acidimicrobiales bacterium]|nr:MAG: hypothetical protein MB52_00810 [marine actinobacterium MedAcidi-G1]|tara:strand:+ start:1228 stop:1674 length:447 start_codon:yes stop_codon:yes gene_type:complete